MEISSSLNENFRGKIIKVIVDEVDDGVALARGEQDAPDVDGNVFFVPKSNKNVTNVRITDSFEYDLEGEEV